MADLLDQDLTDGRIERVDATGASGEFVDLSDVRLRMVDLRGARLDGVAFDDTRIRGAEITNLELSGEIGRLVVNGVDVTAYVDQQLRHRHPDYARMRPTTADQVRAAWDIVERRWDDTVDRARRLDPDLLHERVDGEWSFVETLRHLVFATDSWVNGVLLGDPLPWHPLALPHSELPDHPDVPRDLQARPDLDEVLAARAARQATVRGYLADLTDEQLDGHTTPVEGLAAPGADSWPVRRVVHVVLNEEWWHREYAERDLDVLAGE
jgi:uncharacterized damage-inducible protein DinB